MKNNCPLCEGEMESLYHTEDYKETRFHWRCTKCNHGFYIADLMGMCFKDPVKVKELILKQDKEKEFTQGEEPMCYDCRKNKDYCCDCCDGDLYVSPDAYEIYFGK